MTNSTELPTPREVIIEAMAVEVEAAHEKHVTFDEAMAQHRSRDTDWPWLCPEVEKLRRPNVDCQYMPRSRDDQRAAIAAHAAKVSADSKL